MLQLKHQLILASGSPRRKQLLEGLGVPFEVRKKDTPEDFPTDLPLKMVGRFLAEKKASAFAAEQAENELILTADTTVLTEERLLEKPANATEAAEMLHQLSGTAHLVITGVCLQTTSDKVIFDDTTEVTFSPLTQAEIDWYVQNFQPFDKAGAYGAQEWMGMVAVEKLHGSYFNVMGLPVHLLYQHLKEF